MGPGDGERAESRGRGLIWGADFLCPGQPAQDWGQEGLHSIKTLNFQEQGDAKVIYRIKIQRYSETPKS